MATIETRKTESGGTRYRAMVRVTGYPPAYATFGKMRDAKAWAAQVEADMHGGRYTSDAAAREHTAGEMIDRYIQYILPMKSKKKRYIDAQRSQLNWWKKEIGDYQLIKVTPYVLIECRNKLIRAKRSNATVNRYFSALSHVFTVARTQWNWIQRSPISDVSRLAEPRGRVRYLSRDEIQKLISACRKERKLALYDAVVLALYTGARKDEILSIEPRHVDLSAKRIVLEETKNDERRQLTLSGRAELVAIKRMHELKQGQKYLICGRTRSVKARIDAEFKRACKGAGIEDFHFHDLRHTFASYLAMEGASLAEIAEALGHKTLNMVKRYAHLSDSHTSKVIADMNSKLFEGVETELPTNQQETTNG